MAKGLHVFLTTATGSLSTDTAPVGGGVAVLEALLAYLRAAPDLDVTLLRPRVWSTLPCAPSSLPEGPGAGAIPGEGRAGRSGLRVVELDVPCLQNRPTDHLLHLSERSYAHFALEWERALLDHLRAVPPERAVVVSNDVSEGPPFAALAGLGFAQVVLYHVVVAAFFARQYLRGPFGIAIPATAAARAWRTCERLSLTRFAPRIARLVWAKEAEAARHASAIVPSPSLGRDLARLYPGSGVEARTLVCPWGVIGTPEPARRARREATLARHGIAPERFVLLTLSRISPEKRLELLLRALRRIEAHAPEAADRLALAIAGAPAYMGGRAYEKRLRAESARLERVPVRFVGYLAGDDKWDLIAAADLFSSTSSYEAYGLTIAQALASGTPALATDHQGSRAILGGTTELGWIVPPTARALASAILAALDAPDRRAAAARFGARHPFRNAARAVLATLREAGSRLPAPRPPPCEG